MPAEEIELEDEHEDEIVPPTAPQALRRQAPAIDPAREMANTEATSIVDYIRSLGPSTGAIQVKIHRKSPKMWRGKPIAGLIETHDEIVTEEEIQQLYGGGKYAVQIFRSDGKGKLVYAGQRTVEISGDPKLGVTHGVGNGDGDEIKVDALRDSEANTSVQKTMLGITEGILKDATLRAAKSEEETRTLLRELNGRSGFDPDLMKLFTEPLKMQFEEASRRAVAAEVQNKNLLEKITELQNKKPERDPLVEKLLLDDQGRLNQVRAAHESELSALRLSSREDVKRAEDRADRTIQSAEKAHDREIDHLKLAHTTQIETVRSSFEAQLAVVRGDNARLLRDLEKREAEIKELRAEKQVPLEDQIAKMANLKEALTVLGGGDEKEETTMDKIIDVVGPMVGAVANRIGQPPPTPQQQAAQAAMQAQAMEAQAQAAFAAMSPKEQAAIQLRRQQENRRQLALRQAQASAVVVSEIFVNVSPTDLQQALMFIEGAMTSNKDPVTFAQSIQSMVPRGVIDALRTHGVDKFLETVARVKDDSPLQSVAGRKFVQKVAAVLLGKVPEALVAPVPTEVSPSQ